MRVGAAEVAGRRSDLRECCARHLQDVAQLVAPGAFVDVVEQCAAGVARVGRVHFAGRESGDEVGVDGADDDVTAGDRFPYVLIVVGQPGQLRAGEVRIQAQACQLADPWFVSCIAQAVADRRRTTVLPHDRAARRGEGATVPEHRCLALVGDADRDGCGLVAQCVAAGRQRRLPDLLRGMLDPAGLREVLRELLVAAARDPAVLSDGQCGDPGRSCVDGEDSHGCGDFARSCSSTIGSIAPGSSRSS